VMSFGLWARTGQGIMNEMGLQISPMKKAILKERVTHC